MPITALAPAWAACWSMIWKASSRAFSHSSVYSVMLPPTRVCSEAPMLPTMLRERTVMPRTTPRLAAIRKPSNPNAVVTHCGWIMCGLRCASNLQHVRRAGHVPGAGRGHQGHVLDAHAAQAQVVQARLDRDQVSRAQGAG